MSKDLNTPTAAGQAEAAISELAPQNTVEVPTSLKFIQPTKGVHVYLSENVEGYTVEANPDKKNWTAKFNDTIITSTAPSRANATKAANDHLNPPAPAAEGAASSGEKKAPTLSNREYVVMKAVREGGGNAVNYQDVSDATKLDFATVMGVAAQLGRKGMFTLSAEGAKLTDAGESTYENYVPNQRLVKTTREKKATVSSEEALAAREARMTEKYGPADPSIGPRPTEDEIYEGRILNAKASQNWALLDQRQHRWSPIAAKKVAKANERVALIESEYEAFKNGTLEDWKKTHTPVPTKKSESETEETESE